MQNSFIELLECLIDHKVNYVLVGGLAAAAHGSPQVTQDIDIYINLSSDNLNKLKNAVSSLHPVHRMHPNKPIFQESEESLALLKNIYLQTDYGQLDCLGEIKGLGYYKQVFEKSIEILLHGKQCRILTLDSLIIAKIAMGRPKDKEAVLILQAIKNKNSTHIRK
jgi:predicted nucleotidyltransferase